MADFDVCNFVLILLYKCLWYLEVCAFSSLGACAIVMYGILASGFPQKCLSKKNVNFLFL